MIKAMFFDLDGTLLNSKREIPLSALEALTKCKDKGIKLFLSTARPPSLVKALGWDDYKKSFFSGGVFCNGAIKKIDGVYDYLFIESDIVSKVTAAMQDYKTIGLALQMKNNVHAFKNPLPKDQYKVWGIGNEKVFSTSSCKYDETIKILIYDGDFVNFLNPLPKQLINNISKICGKLAKMYLTDNGSVIQISNKSAGKYNGIEEIRKSLGYCKDEVAVFGDDLNDLEMLRGYKNSVAMGNAAPEVKKIASFITESNDNDGIALAIERLLL